MKREKRRGNENKREIGKLRNKNERTREKREKFEY